MPSWLESKTMFALFSGSAWLVVSLGTLMAFCLIVWGQQGKTFDMGNLVGEVFFAYMVASIVAILTMISGMAIHCLFNRELTIGAKTSWSIFAFLTAPFGAVIYFFTVYKKQAKIHREVVNA
jgi:hypothetical protein